MQALTRTSPAWCRPDEQEPDNLSGVIDYLRTVLERRRFGLDLIGDALQDAFAWGLERCKDGRFTPVNDGREELVRKACASAVRESSRLRRTVSLGRVAEPASPSEPEEEGEPMDLRPLLTAFMKEVWAALEALPQKQGLAVRRYHIEGMTVREIAEREGVTMATVCRNKSRGLAKLRRDLSDRVPPALLRNRRFER
jgi:RNA polymerase sigma factor (sigma-70 family)